MKVDFPEGKISELVVCQTHINIEDDLEGVCVSLEAVLKEMTVDKRESDSSKTDEL